LKIGKESKFSFKEREILEYMRKIAHYEIKEYTFFIRYNATKEEMIFNSRIVMEGEKEDE